MENREDKTLIQEHPEGKGRGFRMKERGLLVQVSGKDLGRTYLLDGVVNLIGRGRECQIRLKDSEISQVHCSVRMDESGALLLEDEGSTNGTLVNGKPLKRARALNFGDRVVIGTTILRFLREETL